MLIPQLQILIFDTIFMTYHLEILWKISTCIRIFIRTFNPPPWWQSINECQGIFVCSLCHNRMLIYLAKLVWNIVNFFFVSLIYIRMIENCCYWIISYMPYFFLSSSCICIMLLNLWWQSYSQFTVNRFKIEVDYSLLQFSTITGACLNLY